MTLQEDAGSQPQQVAATDAAVPPPLPGPAPAARVIVPPLIDVPIEHALIRDALRGWVLFFAAIGLIVAWVVVTLLLGPRFRGNNFTELIIFIILFRLVLGGIGRFFKWRTTRAVLKLVPCAGEFGDGLMLAERLRKIPGLGRPYGMNQLLAVFSVMGYNGHSYRIGPTLSLLPIKPLDVPFEPQPLHELQSELLRETRDENIRGVRSPTLSGHLGRSAALRGGWGWMIAGCLWSLIFTIEYAVRSYQSGQVMLQLVFFGGLLTMFLLSALRPNAGRKSEWFVVPGGLVRRVRPTKDAPMQWQLVKRTESVLAVVRTRGAQWMVCVFGEGYFEQFAATKTECDFLLRGWQSSAPPPTPEQVAGLS